ncbi:hypothetical protein [Thermanaerothrix sp.]|uniref:hypothetical protein n=1 Tax=Thermanaerothrix sp. TaxID=2972675 RepID=UPI003C79AD0F
MRRPSGLGVGLATRRDGTKRLAPRHRLPPSGGCALGLAAGVRGRYGASVPWAGVAARFWDAGFLAKHLFGEVER